MKDSVVVEDLWFRYEIAKDYTLRDVDFRARPGEFILLIGPSGCGKTTLINAINGVIPHVLKGIIKGEVIVSDGEKEYIVKDTPIRILSTIVGTVFQDPEIQFFTLSVLTELAFGPENLMLSPDEIRRRIDFAAKATDIEHLLHKSIFDLSGGQKQRVAIASTLAMMPKVLILDEPTANLDPQGAKEVLSVIDKLVRELNMSVILIEHRLEEVTKYADRVVVMNDGEILAEGSPKKVFGDPQIVDLLYNIGIRPPWHIEILHKVAQRFNVKIDSNDIPLTIEEAARVLSKILLNSNRNAELKKYRELEINYENLSKRRKVIEIRNLWYVYPDGTVALKGINLDIYEGEFVGIIGQNGSGKSTLCLTILGLYKPSHGYVKVLGKDVSMMSLAEASENVGMIFQNPDLMLFQNTVWDEIAFGPKNLGLPPKEISRRVKEALRMMKLVRYKDWKPRALSRGQRHRIAVASILSMRPRILIADEPTTGQDYGSCKEYLELLRRLNEEQKMTIIVVSHTMDIIAKYAKRVIVLKNGRIVADGPTHKIFENKNVLLETDLEQPRVAQIIEELRKYGLQLPLALTAEDFLSII